MAHAALSAKDLNVTDHGGPGRPVVLIHGWPLSSVAWSNQIEPLKAAGMRVITYDRRGFGNALKPEAGFDYDTLVADLHQVLVDLDLHEVTLVGFSMGGGEVARYIGNHGEDRLHSVVFAAAVPPFMLQGPDNPDGSLTQEAAQQMEDGLRADRAGFFDSFVTQFYSVDGEMKVSQGEHEKAVALCLQSDQAAALGCMEAFGTTDFRKDLEKITVPTLILHSDSDAIVPLEGSGKRVFETVRNSELFLIEDAPHGCNVSHAARFNTTLVDYLTR